MVFQVRFSASSEGNETYGGDLKELAMGDVGGSGNTPDGSLVEAAAYLVVHVRRMHNIQLPWTVYSRT